MADLSSITRIWNLLVESNTFNFIIFVSLLAMLFHKINIKGIIGSIQEKVIKVIEEAKSTQKEAEDALLLAEKSIANLDNELKVIVSEAEKSAETIGKKILSEAEKQLENIDNNAKKVIEAEEKLIASTLRKNTSLASVEKAKAHIKNVLSEAPSLQEKYINESIDELDRLNF